MDYLTFNAKLGGFKMNESEIVYKDLIRSAETGEYGVVLWLKTNDKDEAIKKALKIGVEYE